MAGCQVGAAMTTQACPITQPTWDDAAEAPVRELSLRRNIGAFFCHAVIPLTTNQTESIAFIDPCRCDWRIGGHGDVDPPSLVIRESIVDCRAADDHATLKAGLAYSRTLALYYLPGKQAVIVYSRALRRTMLALSPHLAMWVYLQNHEKIP